MQGLGFSNWELIKYHCWYKIPLTMMLSPAARNENFNLKFPACRAAQLAPPHFRARERTSQQKKYGIFGILVLNCELKTNYLQQGQDRIEKEEEVGVAKSKDLQIMSWLVVVVCK